MAAKQVGKAASGSTDTMALRDVLALAATTTQAAALSSASVFVTPGVLASGNAAYLAGLPTSLPSTSGQPWNNGGMVCIS